MGGQHSSAADIHVKTIQHWQLHKRVEVKDLNQLGSLRDLSELLTASLSALSRSATVYAQPNSDPH